MTTRNLQATLATCVILTMGAAFPSYAYATVDTPLQETSEISFLTSDAPDLNSEATTLKTPVAMYEYVKNNFEFALYQGSRGASINTFGGQRGNDVDTASTLIAMLRSQGYPARYAVGTVKRDIATVENWLGVKDPTLAYNLLRLQGVQQVQWVSGTSHGYIQFEQVWVEVLTHVDNYRGTGTDAQTPCGLTDTTCKWVPLAPAFKLRNTGGSLDVTQNADFQGFDYTGYYNAIKNNDPNLMNKNPYEIYEKEVLDYLHTNNPGAALTDVEDWAGIKQESLGLLPLSLPFEIVSTVPVRRYNSVADHDAQVGTGLPESKVWAKYLYVDVYKQKVNANGVAVDDTANPLFQKQKFLLTDLATQKLTLTFAPCFGGVLAQFRLNGNGAGAVCKASSSFTYADPLIVTLYLDGAPDPTGGTADGVITVQYTNDVVGGYYLIGTGGDTSNWSQVHRAAAQLLQANAKYTILNGPSNLNDPTSPQIPYVDSNQDGVVDAGDTPLLNDPQAMDDLTGGLLYTAMNLYFSEAHDAAAEVGKIDHVVAPIDGWVGMVSSVYSVQYIDGTAYSIMPGGLLIDMKGVQFSGIWRDDQPAEFDSDHFELLGHMFSSFEHEIWQQLTGYDAVSTVRGIQMAMANGAQLLDLKSGTLTNSNYAALGFTSTVPSPFVGNSYASFNQYLGVEPYSWSPSTTSGTPHEFYTFEKSISSSVDSLHQSVWDYLSSNGLDNYNKCINSDLNLLLTLNSTGSYTAGPLCDGKSYTGTRTQLIADLKAIYATGGGAPNLVNYFDQDQGFSPTGWTYHTAGAQAINQYDPLFIGGLRNLIGVPADGLTHEVVLPSLLVQGPTYLFSVYLSKAYDPTSGDLDAEGFIISNESYLLAGGGYVDGTQFVDPTQGSTGTNFNNGQINNKTLTSLTNNNSLITPSTSDPVSTVTGNMYHDETDVTIQGRGGLDYVFTRTYNSNVAGATGNGAPFSVGWTHSYNMQLTSNDYGQYPDYPQSQAPENGNGTTSSITYTDERGGQWNYLVDDLPTGSASFAITPPKGMFATLTIDAPVTGQSGVYQDTLAFGNGTSYVFQGGDLKVPGNTAHLVQIQDAYGNQLQFNYTNNQLTSITDNTGISGRGLTLTYLSNGQLQTVSDWTGRTWTYGYDSSGNLKTVTNPAPLSQVTTYVYQPGTHLVIGVIRPATRGGTPVETQFSYYRNNRAFNYSDSLGDTETLDYDLFSKSTRVTDARGFSVTQYYDQNGSLTSLNEKDGGLLYFGNNADLLRNSKEDALGYTTSYTYDQARTFGAASDTYGQVTQETDPLGNTTQTDYETIQTNYGVVDQPSRRQDKNGNQLFYDYYTSADTGSGVVIGKLKDVRILSADAVEDGLNNTMLVSYTYYPSGQPAMQTEYISPAHTRTTTLTYYPGDVDVSDKWVVGGGAAVHTHYTYDSLNRMLTSTVYRSTSPTDPTQIVLTTTWTYDALSRVQTVTDPDGNIEETVYDADGLVAQKLVHYLQPDGSYVTRTLYTNVYDAADRLISRTDTDGDMVQYSYDATGNMLTQTDAIGNVSHFEYDAMGRRTAVIDANGNRTESAYDLDGRVVAIKDGNGNTTAYAYDALGRKTSVVTQLGNTTKLSYDAGGNIIGVKDADLNAGVVTPTNQDHDTISEYYDGLGRRTAIIDANNGEVDKEYDLLGNVTAINDAAGHETDMVYDDLGRLITVKDPLAGTTGKTTQYTYDEAGNMLTKTDRNGAVTQYFYDYLNRLYLTKFIADGTSETRHYNSVGDLDTLSNANVSYSYIFDDMHRLKQVTDSRTGKVMSWVYDKVGNVVQKTDFQGDVTNYQYDSTNRLIAESNTAYVQASYQYDGAGRLLSRILSSGARTEYSYDADNRLLNLSNFGASGALLESLTYGRDSVGNITAITRQDATGTTTTNYTYDTRYELTGVDAPDTAQDLQYTYDAVGNRKALLQADPNNPGQYVQQYGYQYDADNRLNEIDQGTTNTAVKTYTYDFNGQRTETLDSSGNILQQIAWDQKGRIASVTQGGQTSTMGYDSSDYRISKQTSSATTAYYLEDKNLEAEYDGNGNLKEKFLRGAVVDELLYGYSYDSNGKATAATYYHDQVTSVTDETAPDGTSLASFQYDPFGNLTSSTGAPISDLQYTGRNFDSESGLYYYRARYYDPTIGRFISEDPKGFAAGNNFYEYAFNSPLTANDPTGFNGQGQPTGQSFVPGSLQQLGSVLYDQWSSGEMWGNVTKAAKPTVTVMAGAAETFAGAATGNYALILYGANNAAGGVTSFVNTFCDTNYNGNLIKSGFADIATVSGVDPNFGNTAYDLIDLTANVQSLFKVTSWSSWSNVPGLGDGGLVTNTTTQVFQDITTGNWLPPTFDLMSFSSDAQSFGTDASAAGGFVIYPNSLNLNSSTSVYKK